MAPTLILLAASSSFAAQIDSIESCPETLSVSLTNITVLSADDVAAATFQVAAAAVEPARSSLSDFKTLLFYGTLGSSFDGSCHYFTAGDSHFPMGEITARWGSPTLHLTVFENGIDYDVFADLEEPADGDVFATPSGQSATITHRPELDGAQRAPYVKIGYATLQ